MSAAYKVEGFVTIKVPIDDVYSCSQSSSEDDIADIVKWNLTCKIGECEMINHGLKLVRLS